MRGSSGPPKTRPILTCARCIALLRRVRDYAVASGLGKFGDTPFDLGTEMADQALDRPGRRIAQGADGVALDLLADFLQQIDLPHLGVATHHASHHPPPPAGAFAA